MTVGRTPTRSATQPITTPPAPVPTQTKAPAKATTERSLSSAAAIGLSPTTTTSGAPKAIDRIAKASPAADHDARPSMPSALRPPGRAATGCRPSIPTAPALPPLAARCSILLVTALPYSRHPSKAAGDDTALSRRKSGALSAVWATAKADPDIRGPECALRAFPPYLVPCLSNARVPPEQAVAAPLSRPRMARRRRFRRGVP